MDVVYPNVASTAARAYKDADGILNILTIELAMMWPAFYTQHRQMFLDN